MRNDEPKKIGLFKSLGLGVRSWSLKDALDKLFRMAEIIEGKHKEKTERETNPPTDQSNTN